MKIIILDGYTENPGDLSWDGFSALGDLTVYDRTPPEDVAERIGDAQIVLTNKTPVTRETLKRCPEVRYIGVLATGYNIVDVGAARERGIVVSNIPTYGTAAVAQFVFALMLGLCHHVGSSEAADIRRNARNTSSSPTSSTNPSTSGGPGVYSGAWLRDDVGWWYCNADKSYTTNNWQYINNYWYFFDERGYMKTGWILWNGKWYYCCENGEMLHDTTTPDGYYVGSDGVWVQ